MKKITFNTQVGGKINRPGQLAPTPATKVIIIFSDFQGQLAPRGGKPTREQDKLEHQTR